MNLPLSFFYKFFKENNFFVIDNIVYNLKAFPGEAGTFFIGKKRFGINEGLKLSKIEEVYFSNYNTTLKEYGNRIVGKILQEEKGIYKDYHNLGQEIELIEFVFYNLIKKEKKNIKEVKTLKVQSRNIPLIEEILNHNCFVQEGNIYLLKEGKKGNVFAKIKDRCYYSDKCLDKSLEDLEKNYIKKVEEKICNELTKGQDSLLDQIKSLNKKKEIIKLINKGEFYDQKEEVGFLKDDFGFFVVRKIKPYILYENWNNKYYQFGEAIIGIKLGKKGRKIQWHDPIVINPYIHPALPDTNWNSHQKICKGNYDYQQATKGRSLEESIRILLGEGKRMLTSGYYGVKGAWHFLTEEPFQKLEVKQYDPTEVSNR